MDSLLHVVLPGVDVLQPQELLRAVQGVRGEGGLGHVPRARPGEEPRREEKLSFMGCSLKCQPVKWISEHSS